MESYLEEDKRVILNKELETYAIIKSYVDNGSLSVVYKVEYHCYNSDGSYSDKKALMKEFFPSGNNGELYDYFTRVDYDNAYYGFEVDPNQYIRDEVNALFCRFKDNEIYDELIKNNKLSKYVVNIKDQFLSYNKKGDSLCKGIFITDDDFCNSCKEMFLNKSIVSNLKFLHTLVNIVDDFHSEGYLIPDLKPSNLIYDKDYTTKLKLIDFDSVIRISDLPECVIPRTKGYVSPEIDNGELEKIDIRSDIYTLGIIFVEIIFGRLWYDIVENHQHIHEIISFGNLFLFYGLEEALVNNEYISEKNDKFKFSKGTIRKVKNILQKSVCHNMIYRYNTCKEMANDIQILIEIIKNKGVHPEVMLDSAIELSNNKNFFNEDDFEKELLCDIEEVK